MPRILRPLAAIAVLVCAVALSGCVQIVHQSEQQRDTIGDVEISTTVCLSQNPYLQGQTCPDDQSNSTQDAGASGASQLLVAYRVPDAAIAPDTVEATYVSGGSGSTTLRRSDSYTSELNAKAPGVAGEHWVGYLSPSIPDTSQPGGARAEIVAEFGLGHAADGSPFRGPFSYRTVVGARAVGDAGSNRPVACADDVTTNTSMDDVEICVDSPAGGEGAFVDDDRAIATKDLGVLNGATATAAPGSAATIPFTIRSAGLNNGPSLSLSAGTTVLGGSAIPGQASVSAQAGDATVPVTLNVPTTTAPGSYDVTLTATYGSQTRTGHGTLTVVAPPTTGPSGGGVAKPKLTVSIPRQRLGHALAHGLRVKTHCDESCGLNVKLGRYGSGKAALAAPGSKVVTARFTSKWRRKLRHAHSLTLTLRAAAGHAGQTTTVSRRLKLSR